MSANVGSWKNLKDLKDPPPLPPVATAEEDRRVYPRFRRRGTPPPQDHRKALCIGLLLGPRRGLFLMGEVPL